MSLALKPDIHSSSDEYAARFSGSVGQWMLDVQTEALHACLDSRLDTILDVGGGHAQIAKPLIAAGKKVTVLGSTPDCAAQIGDEIDSGKLSFSVGDIVRLPFADKSFDAVVSFRILSHLDNWNELVAEMCRVARYAVIVDYPVWTSINILSPLLFQLKKLIEKNTRSFGLFSNAQMRREFSTHGFKQTGVHKQFVFPMALHRALKNTKISAQLENTARIMGLRSLAGSPVIGKFERE